MCILQSPHHAIWCRNENFFGITTNCFRLFLCLYALLTVVVLPLRGAQGAPHTLHREGKPQLQSIHPPPPLF